ncbi:MAG TPA: hypothetical protein PL119_01605 [Bacteroidales bacterium]|nr:hypothetical protein [Bacteroidales bacterium]
MKGFNAGIYLRRVLKYVIFYTVFILALLALVYFTGGNHSISFWELIRPGSQKNLILLIVAFSAVYPFIGFISKEVPVNRFQATDKEAVCRFAAEAGFILVSDDNGKMVFKARRVGMRLFRVFEDKITVDYNENPLVVDGMRRDALRIARHMEYYFRQVGKE